MLDLALVGILPLNGTLPVIAASTAFFLFVCTLWALLLALTPVAGITGTFSGFWASLTALQAAMGSNRPRRWIHR